MLILHALLQERLLKPLSGFSGMSGEMRDLAAIISRVLHIYTYYPASTDKQEAQMLKIKHVEELLLCKVVAIGCENRPQVIYVTHQVCPLESSRELCCE